MKKIYFPLFAIAALTLASCGSKDSPDVPEVVNGVEVTIETASIQTKKAQLEFQSNDKMNIYAKKGRLITDKNLIDDVSATFDGSKWTMSPKVVINEEQKNAFIFAVSPYDPTYVDPTAIPVDLSRQVDLMYSGSYQPASMTSPKVKLTMKHALSLLSFNIVPVNFTGAGAVTQITLNGDPLYTTAKMDASTGIIDPNSKSGNNTDVTGKFDRKVEAGGWKSNIPGVWSTEFITKGSNVKVKVVIDGRTFETYLPEVDVRQGWQYIFRLALTDNGLEFDPTKTEKISLNVSEDSAQTFNGYGAIRLTANGTWLNSPLLKGNNLFGTLVWPGTSKSYSTSEKIEGLKSGDQVSVESWNTEGFEIVTLDGIDTIDISEYE